MTTKELKDFLAWRIKHDAVNTSQACEILGIRQPSLHAMRMRGDIEGRFGEREWWYPLKEVEKNKVDANETRRGRPRSGVA